MALGTPKAGASMREPEKYDTSPGCLTLLRMTLIVF